MNIEGSTIRLRDILNKDIDAYRLWQQPGHRWQALDGPYYPKASPAEIEQIIEDIEARIESDGWPEPRTRLIIADVQTDELLGVVSRYWISRETHWAALGIVIYDPAYWGQGVGYEALGMWMDYLLDHFPDWVRLDLRTWSGNHGMIRLAEKLGYRQEACFRKARIVDGVHYASLGFGILREEWRTRYPDGFVIPNEDDAEVVADAEEQLAEAHIKLNLQTIDRLLHPDYVVIQPGGLTETKAEVLASYRTGTRHWETAKVDQLDIRLYRNTALVIGRWQASGWNGEERFDYSARFLSIWFKQDGRWQNIAYQATELKGS